MAKLLVKVFSLSMSGRPGNEVACADYIVLTKIFPHFNPQISGSDFLRRCGPGDNFAPALRDKLQSLADAVCVESVACTVERTLSASSGKAAGTSGRVDEETISHPVQASAVGERGHSGVCWLCSTQYIRYIYRTLIS